MSRQGWHAVILCMALCCAAMIKMLSRQLWAKRGIQLIDVGHIG